MATHVTAGGALGRLQEIAAKHGVRYDEASGKFKVGPIAMSAESAALRTGRAEKDALDPSMPYDRVGPVGDLDKSPLTAYLVFSKPD